MIIPFAFGKETIPVDIPDKNLMGVLQANPIRITQDESEIVRDALQHPIGSDCLCDIIHQGEKVVIITSDITRPMPSAKVLPIVLEELSQSGVSDEDITIVFALGSHRGHSEEEKKKIVGEAVYERFRCIDSNGEVTHLGTTKAGTPVDIFTPVVEADRRICLGNIEYHYFAGYSGGAKAIMPGVSTREAIQANHREMIDPRACTGKIEGNPVREDIEAVIDFVPVDFIVNVVLDEHKHICQCVCGDVIKAHRAGCQLLDAMYRVSIPKQADIVIVSPGGYPKDINLYQAQKALDNAAHAVRDGGSILWIASAKEGLGEKHFEDWMLGHADPLDMIDHIRREFVLGGHKAAAIAMVMKRAKIYLVSDLDAAFVQGIHMTPENDAQLALERLLIQYGTQAQILAMPFGGATLPMVRSE